MLDYDAVVIYIIVSPSAESMLNVDWLNMVQLLVPLPA